MNYFDTFLDLTHTIQLVRHFTERNKVEPRLALECMKKAESELEATYRQVKKDKTLSSQAKETLIKDLSQKAGYLYDTKIKVYRDVQEHFNPKHPYWVSECALNLLSILPSQLEEKEQLEQKCDLFKKAAGEVSLRRIKESTSFPLNEAADTIAHLKMEGAFLWEEIEQQTTFTPLEKIALKTKISFAMYMLDGSEECIAIDALEDLQDAARDTENLKFVTQAALATLGR